MVIALIPWRLAGLDPAKHRNCQTQSGCFILLKHRSSTTHCYSPFIGSRRVQVPDKYRICYYNTLHSPLSLLHLFRALHLTFNFLSSRFSP